MRVASNNNSYDLIVIGGGSGGVRAARMAAGYGARVAIVERQFWGGTCVNIGCVPKKLFVYGAEFGDAFLDAQGYGWELSAPPTLNWTTLRHNKDQEIARLSGIYERLLAEAGVELLWGDATELWEAEVRVGQQHHRAQDILVATGGVPYRPPTPGIEHALVSDDVFSLPELPQSIAVVGGGYIAMEFVGIFAGLGVDTHLIYRRDLPLRGFDEDLRRCLAEDLQKSGVHCHFETDIREISLADAGQRVLHLTGDTTLPVDAVMFATGRQPATLGLGLEHAGVAVNANGAIEVDAYHRTNVAGIYAIGDVTGGHQLTPVALAQGMAVARTIGLKQPTRTDLQQIPTAVFSRPPLATVGLTEAEARTQYPDVRVFRSQFTPLKMTLSRRSEQALVKLVVDGTTDRVLGAHMVGEHGAEIIQGLAVAVNAGLTKAQFDATLGIHPTAAEEFVTLRTPVGD